MKKILSLLAVIFSLLLAIIFIPTSTSKAQNNQCDPAALANCKDPNVCPNVLQQCMSNLSQALAQSENATHPLESQLASMQTQIQGIKDSIVSIEQNVAIQQQQINASYADLQTKKALLDHAISNFYIKQTYNSPLLVLFSGKSATEMTQILQYQKVAADEDKQIITNIAVTINSLQQQQQALEAEKVRLAALQSSLDEQSAKLDKIVQGAHAYQAVLSSQIAQLSSQQQALLAAKYASLGIPLYAYSTSGGCSSDIAPYKDPGFSGTKFGFFTYGVPNRVGLNQYGAYGRATANPPQNADQILHAYYNFDNYETIDPNSITIKVNDGNGYNTGNIVWTGNLDQYIRRLYEVPASWPSEALKAQAIAAMSYVLAETDNGAKSICSNTHCQVFQTGEKGGGWGDAITSIENDNGGKLKVMTQGGQVITAWFSSTHGGYVYASGGDVGGASWTKNAQDVPAGVSINSFADLNNNAYDKASPWFYCDWGGRASNNNTAWLTSSEIADIANVILLLQRDSSVISHVSQVDKPNPDGTDTWDANRVKQELSSRGGTPFNSVSGISVSADFNIGKVTSVTISGDAPTQSISGDQFRQYFNLRAPANIQIVGPLFNIEMR